MKAIKKSNEYSLNKGEGMAAGLFNVTCDTLLETTDTGGCSNWFGSDTKDKLMKMSKSDFENWCNVQIFVDNN